VRGGAEKSPESFWHMSDSTDDLYREFIIEEYSNPQNKGQLPDADVVHKEENASCGDMMTVYLKVQDNSLSDIKWSGIGCAISVASMSLVSQYAKGKTFAEIQAVTKKDLEEVLGIRDISPNREKCLMLGLRAVQKAIIKL